MGNNTVFTLKAILGLDSTEYEKGLGDAKSKAGSVGSAIGNGLKTAAKIGVAAIGTASTAVTAFVGSAVNVGASFDKSMSQVYATMGDNANKVITYNGQVMKSSEALRDFAQVMGRETKFSATEAADALNYMALAGYDAEMSMKMLPNVLNLAAAGAMDLAKASDMVTDTQTAFGISSVRTSEMVAEMAKAASTGNTSVEQLGDAFLTVGGLAQELNGGLITLADGSTQSVDGVQELEIALTAMANAGIKGSEAGTHMRNMLLKLASPTSDGTKALQEMGVAVFDTEGNMRSLADVFGDLSDKLGNMTQEAKIQTISDLFNTRDLSSAEALLNAVTDDWDKIGESITSAQEAGVLYMGQVYTMDEALTQFGDEIYNSAAGFQVLNAAEKMALDQQDNLDGSITSLKSAFEGLQIAVSDEVTPTLRKFVDFGTNGLRQIVNAFDVGGMDGAMQAITRVLKQGISMITAMMPDMINAGMQLLGALGKGIIDNIPQIVDAAVQIVVMLSEGLVKALPQLAKGAVTLIKSLGEAFKANSGELMGVGAELLNLLWEGITEGLPMLVEGATEIMGKFGEYLGNAIPELLPVALNAIMEFSGSLRENAGQLVDAGLEMIMNIANGLIEALPSMIETIPTIVTNIAGIINDNAPKLLATGIELIGNLLSGIISAIPTLIAEFPKIVEAIFAVITAVNWVSLGTHIITFIGDGVKSLASNIPNMLKEIGNKAVDFLKNINWSNLGKNIVTFIVNGIRGLSTTIPNALKAIATEALNVVKNVNWLELGINIVAGIASGITNAAGMVWDAITGMAQGAWEAVTGIFDIHSPSRKMAWAGKMIDEGFAQGITKNMGIVDNAFDELKEYTTPIETSVSTSTSQSTDNRVLSLLQQIADANKNVTIVLEGDTQRLFRAMQYESKRNQEITGETSFA